MNQRLVEEFRHAIGPDAVLTEPVQLVTYECDALPHLRSMRLEGDKEATIAPPKYTTGQLVSAWLPYLMLVLFVLVWGEPRFKPTINAIGDMARLRGSPTR